MLDDLAWAAFIKFEMSTSQILQISSLVVFFSVDDVLVSVVVSDRNSSTTITGLARKQKSR